MGISSAFQETQQDQICPIRTRRVDSLGCRLVLKRCGESQVTSCSSGFRVLVLSCCRDKTLSLVTCPRLTALEARNLESTKRLELVYLVDLSGMQRSLHPRKWVAKFIFHILENIYH